jgi:4a-hydroxytetrahydrobiopterin dehydratase
MPLEDKECVPCKGSVAALRGAALNQLKHELSGWEVVNEHHLHKTYAFPDFMTGLAFVNRAGAIAEEQGHHPDLLLAWGRVEVTIFTHTIEGLTESDFILAAKIDASFRQTAKR